MLSAADSSRRTDSGALRRTHVHVHPDVVLSADVGDGVERVEGAVHRRPCGGADEERDETLHGEGGVGQTCKLGLLLVDLSGRRHVRHLLFGLQYSPLQVGWDQFAAVTNKQTSVARR